MLSQGLARGLTLAVIALAFGSGALQLPIGTLSQSGAGLFPLLVSSFMLILAVVIIAKSLVVASEPLHLNVKNIGIILVGLLGFVVCSELIDMAAGTVWLVFVSAFAGASYSWERNLKVSLTLILIALMFEKFLALNLRVI